MGNKKNDLIQMPKEMQDIVDMKVEYQEKIKVVGKKAVKALFENVFTKFPEVESIRWAQYTPYFNDGDACEFGLGQFYFGISKEQDHTLFADEACEDIDEDDESKDVTYVYNFGKYDYSSRTTVYPTKRHEELQDALRQVEGACQDLEDVLGSTFGDHVQITVTRNKIEVEDHDHD